MVSRIRPSLTLSGLQASGLCSAAHFMRAVSRGDDACFVSVFCGALLAPEDELPPGESTAPSFEVVSDSCPAHDCSPTDDEHGTEHCATASYGHHHLLLICPAPFGVMTDVRIAFAPKSRTCENFSAGRMCEFAADDCIDEICAGGIICSARYEILRASAAPLCPLVPPSSSMCRSWLLPRP